MYDHLANCVKNQNAHYFLKPTALGHTRRFVWSERNKYSAARFSVDDVDDCRTVPTYGNSGMHFAPSARIMRPSSHQHVGRTSLITRFIQQHCTGCLRGLEIRCLRYLPNVGQRIEGSQERLSIPIVPKRDQSSHSSCRCHNTKFVHRVHGR